MSRSFLLLALTGCSLGPNPDACTSNQQCRSSFGLGSVCGEEGFCTTAALHPRCDSTAPADALTRPERYGDHLVLGTMFASSTDQPQVRSAQLAVTHLNDVGGLDGKEFVAVSCSYEPDSSIDDLDSTAATEELTRWFAESLGAAAVVGPASSDRSLEAYAVAANLDLLLVSPSATSPLLTEVDGTSHTDDAPGLFWRTVPPDDLQGRVMAWDLQGRGVTDVAIVHEDSSYASALADVFAEQFAGLVSGARIERFSFDNDTRRSEAIVDAGNAAVQEVIFLSSEAEDHVAFFEAAAISQDYLDPDHDPGNPLEIFLADAGADPFILAEAPTAVEVLSSQVRGTRPQVPSGDVFETFQAAYVGEYGEDPRDAVFAPYSYDAAWLALYGHAWATFQEDGLGGLNVARGLRKLSADVEELKVRPGSWVDVVDAFASGTEVNLDGASGKLDFDPSSGETSGPIEVWVIDQDLTGIVAVELCQPDGTCDPV